MRYTRRELGTELGTYRKVVNAGYGPVCFPDTLLLTHSLHDPARGLLL